MLMSDRSRGLGDWSIQAEEDGGKPGVMGAGGPLIQQPQFPVG